MRTTASFNCSFVLLYYIHLHSRDLACIGKVDGGSLKISEVLNFARKKESVAKSQWDPSSIHFT